MWKSKQILSGVYIDLVWQGDILIKLNNCYYNKWGELLGALK